MIIDQFILFNIYILTGIAICLLFDFFRALRKNFKTSNNVTLIEDILFWIIAGIFLILIINKFSYGELRLYPLIGLVIGIAVFFRFISRFTIKIYITFIYYIKRVIVVIANLIVSIFLNPTKNFIIKYKNNNTIKHRL